MPDRDVLPAPLDEERHVQLRRRAGEPWTRRVFVAVFTAILVLALIGVFGQRDQISTAAGPAASVRIAAPDRLRGGLFYQARIDVTATRGVGHPRLELSRGWTHQMQINTIEPAATDETSRNGRLVLEYGALEPGDHLTVWIQFEVNPTGAGRRDQSLRLLDGSELIARADRTLTVFP